MTDATVEFEKAAADIPLTRSARDVLERAAAFASARGALQADPVDVLKATLESRGNLASQTISALGSDPAGIQAALQPPDGTPGLPMRQLLVNANREAGVLGHYQVDSIHLLLAMLYSDSPVTSAALQRAGLTLYDLRRHLQTAAKPTFAGDPRSAPRVDAKLRRKPWPSLRGVVSISPIFLALVATTAGAGVLLWFDVLPSAVSILTIVFVAVGWISSVCVHEFGHALVAYLGGDRNVAANGYLSLNPLRYLNILMSVILPIAFLLLGGIALPGAAVYIDHTALRSRLWDSAVSLAGPVGTLFCGVLVAIPFLIPNHLSWMVLHLDFFEALAYLGFIEAFALLLNLLPVPGLDGFGILRPWLPYAAQDFANRLGMVAIIGVFLVLWYVPPVSSAFFETVSRVTNVVGIDYGLIYFGQTHMRPG